MIRYHIFCIHRKIICTVHTCVRVYRHRSVIILPAPFVTGQYSTVITSYSCQLFKKPPSLYVQAGFPHMAHFQTHQPKKDKKAAPHGPSSTHEKRKTAKISPKTHQVLQNVLLPTLDSNSKTARTRNIKPNQSCCRKTHTEAPMLQGILQEK